MKIFMTGGTGFLGTALARELRARGHEVTAPGSRDCDLRREDSLEPFGEERFDRIFHLAAWTQAGDFCLHHPGEQWVVNQRLNTNVLDWWQRRQPQAKLVCMGSSCVYDPELDLSEENYLRGVPVESLFSYGMTKKMLFAGLVSLQRQYGLEYLCLVPSTLYGPGYHTDGRQMHFIFDLVRKIMRGRLYGEPVELWGDGHQRRELVYLDDFVDLALRLADTRHDELINVGAGEEFTIRHFAGLICERVGYPFSEIRFDTDRYVGARSKCLRIDRLRSLVPDLRFTPLAEGLNRTIAWFEAERDRVLPAP